MSEIDSRYDPTALEKKWYQIWEKGRYFHADENSPRKPFTIVIPPPNITGILHIGHGLNNTIQDVIIRRKRMQGRLALWLPGTDHAGIATQNMVEREILKEGKKKEDLGREEFLRRVWKWREEKGGTIIEQLKRLGSSCDWERIRFTLDEGLARAVGAVFKRLFDEGLVYKGSYIVNWCPRCLTALAEDEVDYKELKGKLWHIKYPVAGEKDRYCIVATTRPETMLGDTAVAVNPTDERYRDLVGKEAILPLLNRPIKIIADEFVSKEFGTGMVKVTPAHDPNDYQIGKRHKLPEINILHKDARVNENGGPYEGLDRYAARKKVVEDLEELGLIEKIEDYVHSVGHCYRCHTAIEPYISEQWFVRMKELAEPAIEAVEQGKTRFAPQMWENTYFHWMRNVRDWCISRQLWWGHRIPAWYCDTCGHIMVSIDEAPQKCSKCGSTSLTQDPDVLDTWFSSALWPFSTLGWPEKTKDLAVFYPTSVLVTAHEILFFWVARMIMMGLKFMGDVPFHDVYIHAMVFDEHTKKKMSKSLGNVIDPLEMIDKYGADALRMTLCAYAIKGKNLYLSEERFVGYRNFMNKVWNAARFVLTNTQDLTPEDMAQGINEELLTLQDRWILSSFARTVREADAALDDYSFDQLVSALYHFVWHRYCDWYLEFCKSILNPGNGEQNEKNRALRTNTQRILVFILEGMLRLLHPVIPFITEELWQKIRERYNPENYVGNEKPKGAGKKFMEILSAPSIMIASWEQAIGEDFINDEAEKAQELAREVINAVRNIRGEMNIPPGVATDVSIKGGEKGNLDIVKANRNQLDALLNAKELRLGEDAPQGAFSSTGVVQDLTLFVVLPDEMREEEINRLRKELEKSEKELSTLETKMKNENFVNKAPKEIVAKTRDRMEQAQREKGRINEQLERLTIKNEK
ncbi:valine--tRNA ligase [Candidatus Sumerlaeota bacterium]|nr:valine--tRNA ligase [Candidatus Sumerlaeota bacterium]